MTTTDDHAARVEIRVREVHDIVARIRSSRHIPFEPTEKQWLFLTDPHFEVMTGGSTGPGKSVALLMDALAYVNEPGYNALMLRRTFPELSGPDGLIAEARSWLGGTDAQASDGGRRWTFPNGSSLSFGHMDTDDDRFKYASSQYSRIYFDELTTFSLTQYTFMFTRIRKPVRRMTIPLAMRSACVDEGDVLTESGWVPIQDVQVGDLVQSVDRHGHMSLKPVLWTFTGPSPGHLVRIRKKNLYASMTPDHRVLYRRYGSPTYELGPFDEHVGRCISMVRTSTTYEGGVGFHDAPLGLDTDTYLDYLGLFLAEGCTNTTVVKGNHRVVVTQCDPGGAVTVTSLMDRLGVNYFHSRGGDFVITNKAWRDHFAPFGKAHEKFVPRKVMESATPAQLRRLLDWMVFGDGHVRGESITYITVSPRLADDVAEIGIKLGYRAQVTRLELSDPNHRDRYSVYLTRTRDTQVTKVDKNEVRNDVELEPYDGLVHCIKVADNETFVLRQQGKVWISGNTNPIGRGLKWVRERFVDGADISGLHDAGLQAAVGGTAHRPIIVRNFIPALASDNPYLDQGSYELSMAMLDPLTKARLKHGRWDVSASGNFYDLTNLGMAYTFTPTGPVVMVRAWDTAATDGAGDYTVGMLVAFDRASLRYTIVDMVRGQWAPAQLESMMAATANADADRFGSVRQVLEQEPGSSGKLAARDLGRRVLAGHEVVSRTATGAKAERARLSSALIDRGDVDLVLAPWNGDFRDELVAFAENPKESGEHDDIVDALSAACHEIRRMIGSQSTADTSAVDTFRRMSVVTSDAAKNTGPPRVGIPGLGAPSSSPFGHGFRR